MIPSLRLTCPMVDDSVDDTHDLVACDMDNDGRPNIIMAQMRQLARLDVLG